MSDYPNQGMEEIYVLMMDDPLILQMLGRAVCRTSFSICNITSDSICWMGRLSTDGNEYASMGQLDGGHYVHCFQKKIISKCDYFVVLCWIFWIGWAIWGGVANWCLLTHSYCGISSGRDRLSKRGSSILRNFVCDFILCPNTNCD